MDNASKNAGDMIDSLTLQYNRGRQAAITNELVDIITGASFTAYTHDRYSMGNYSHYLQVPALCSVICRLSSGADGSCEDVGTIIIRLELFTAVTLRIKILTNLLYLFIE